MKLLFCTVFFFLQISAVSLRSPHPPTANFQSIFIGKCWEYQRLLWPNDFEGSNLKDCSNLWSLFTSAYSALPPCRVNLSNYEPFAQAAVMFWSKTPDFVHNYTADNRATAISNTLLGYMANRATWCGGSSDCPFDNPVSCPNNSVMAYWRQVSIKFATNAEGKVRLMLNADVAVPFNRSSTFARYELPFLNAKKNPSLQVIMAHNYSKRKLSSCNSESVQRLKNTVDAKNITYSCVENPPDVKALMCSADISNVACRALTSQAKRNVISVWSFVIITTLLFLTENSFL